MHAATVDSHAVGDRIDEAPGRISAPVCAAAASTEQGARRAQIGAVALQRVRAVRLLRRCWSILVQRPGSAGCRKQREYRQCYHYGADQTRRAKLPLVI